MIHEAGTRPARAALRPVTPVSILGRELDLLRDELTGAGSAVPATALARLDRAGRLCNGLDAYLSAMTVADSGQLRTVAAHTLTRPWATADDAAPGHVTGLEPEMLSGHVEGQLLRFLVAVSGARRVLEIGTFTGYSALAMAEALPPDGHLTTCEADVRVAAVARAAFASSPQAAQITLETGPAMRTLERLAARGAVFDFAFIDADKTGYWAYLDFAYRAGLFRAGTVVAVDNTLYQGEVYRDPARRSRLGQAVAEFNERVAAHPAFEQVLLPLRDGVTLIRVRGGAPADGAGRSRGLECPS